MRVLGGVLLLSVFLLLAACKDNQLTGSVVSEGLSCVDLRTNLYDNTACNLNCKANEVCKPVEEQGMTCYECQALSMEEWDEVSCWNGAVLSGTELGNQTRFPANHTNQTNVTSSYSFFCVDDCPPGYTCNAACICVEPPEPKITCDKIKQKANGQPLSANANCDGKCPPNLCKAYNIPGTQPVLTCYACVQPECPPPTVRLQECMLYCGNNGQCMLRLAVGGQACYTCEERTNVDVERPVTQPNWDEYHPDDQAVTSVDDDRVTTPQPVDCNQYCGSQGMSASPVDYSGFIRNYVNQYQCVSGARIRIQTRTYGNCRCYPQQPEITIDQTPPVCRGTPCGDVACGQSASCSCGERCTQTVTCSWGGWQVGSQSATPIVGTQSS